MDCGYDACADEQPAPDKITVLVENNSLENYSIYLVTNGAHQRMGGSYETHKSSFDVAKVMFPANQSFALALGQPGSGLVWVDAPQTLIPGRKIVVVINSPVKYSYVYQK